MTHLHDWTLSQGKTRQKNLRSYGLEHYDAASKKVLSGISSGVCCVFKVFFQGFLQILLLGFLQNIVPTFLMQWFGISSGLSSMIFFQVFLLGFFQKDILGFMQKIYLRFLKWFPILWFLFETMWGFILKYLLRNSSKGNFWDSSKSFTWGFSWRIVVLFSVFFFLEYPDISFGILSHGPSEIFQVLLRFFKSLQKILSKTFWHSSCSSFWEFLFMTLWLFFTGIGFGILPEIHSRINAKRLSEIYEGVSWFFFRKLLFFAEVTPNIFLLFFQKLFPWFCK